MSKSEARKEERNDEKGRNLGLYLYGLFCC
jgi:hypothetical protein